MKTFTLQVFREYPLSSQRWSCPQEYLKDYVCQQFLLHFSQIGKSFSLKPCWTKNRWVLQGWLVCMSLCASLFFQNANFEGKNRRRPSVNSKSFLNEKSFLRSLGLLGNESQLLKWRLSLCRSQETILYHLKGENVLCASSFFFISAKWANVSAWSLVEKNQYRIRPWVNRNSFSHEKNFVFSLGLLGNDLNLNCSSEDFYFAGLQRISFITSRVNMSPRVLNSFYVPAVSFFISAKMGKSFSLKPCWKETCEFCQDGLFVCTCV